MVAVGNPFGLGGTGTSGIVSARERDIQSGPLDDFIRVDALINRGNSGGPLFDTQARVVSVNTAIYSPNGGNVGIAFSVPASLAQQIIAELKEKCRIERGWLSVSIQLVIRDIAAPRTWVRDQGPLSLQGPGRDTLIRALIPAAGASPANGSERGRPPNYPVFERA